MLANFSAVSEESGRVLIVEDETLAALSLYTLLKARGWAVDVASSIGEATSKIAKHPNVILIDLNLPDGEGEQILQLIKDQELPARVLVLTGVTDEKRLDFVKSFSPSAMLTKPASFSQIIDQVTGN